eukprot:PhM_4_TR16805/c1_g1_i10/m.52120
MQDASSSFSSTADVTELRSSRDTSFRNSTMSSLHKSFKNQGLSSVVRKRISVLVINVTGTHKHFEKHEPTASAKHAAYVKTVMDVVTERLGTPDVFLGDRFLATWNTVKRRA